MATAEPRFNSPRVESTESEVNLFDVLDAQRVLMEAALHELLKAHRPKDWSEEQRAFMDDFYQKIESLLTKVGTARDGAEPTTNADPSTQRQGYLTRS